MRWVLILLFSEWVSDYRGRSVYWYYYSLSEWVSDYWGSSGYLYYYSLREQGIIGAQVGTYTTILWVSEWLLGLKWVLILLFSEWVSDYWGSSGYLYYYSLSEWMIIRAQVGTYTTILWVSEWLLGLKWELILLFSEWVSDYLDSSGYIYYYSLNERVIIGAQVGTYTTILWGSEWLLGLKWIRILLFSEGVSDYWGSSWYLYYYSLREWVIIGAQVGTYTTILWGSEWLLGLKWILILLFSEGVNDYWGWSRYLYYYSLREWVIIWAQVGTYTTILWGSKWLLGLKWVLILLFSEGVSDYWGSSRYLYYYSLREWVIIWAQVDTYTTILWGSEWLLGLKSVLMLLFSEGVSDYWASSGYLY